MVKKLKAMANKSRGDSQLAGAVKESAHEIWLAGLGAFAKAQEEGQKVFKALVREGSSMQQRTMKATEEKVSDVTGRVNDVTSKVSQVAAGLQKQATGTWDKLEGVFEARVQRALNRLSVPTNREINALAKRVEELSRNVASATRAKPARKAPVKRAKSAKKVAKRLRLREESNAGPWRKKALYRPLLRRRCEYRSGRHEVPDDVGGAAAPGCGSRRSRYSLKMERKPPRRTRERILDVALRLFNDFGEPNVNTTLISEEMKISPGNLYYHFKNKDDIINCIFQEFEREMDQLLAVPTGRSANVEDAWLFLHLLFEQIWKYRFFYRDLNNLLANNRTLEIKFKELLNEKVQVARRLCEGLQSAGELSANPRELEALATNMVVVATYWLSYSYVLDPRRSNEPAVVGEALQRGCYQTMALTAPYLRGDARALFEKLAVEYLGN